MGKPTTRRTRKPGAPRKTANDRHAYVLEDQVGFLLRLANQRHTAIFAAKMIEDLTPAQFSVLHKLREIGPCSQNHLGRLISVDAATIKGVIDRLSARGLIKRTRDPRDRRIRAIALSPAGQAIADRSVATAAAISKATLAPLKPAQRTLLVKLLRAIT